MSLFMPHMTMELLPTAMRQSIRQSGVIPQAHFIGATGTGMKGLAEILLDEGWNLSGSDAASDPEIVASFARRGMSIGIEHRSAAVTETTQLVIYSAAIPEKNYERERARQLGIPQLSYVEAISRIMNPRRGIAVAGTHGKSSTTALIAYLLEQAEEFPTFLCGAQRTSDGRNGKAGNSDWVVVEACEYRSHFLTLRPQRICLLGVEHDHFDCFPTFDQMLAAYRSFLSGLPEQGELVYNFDCEISRNLVRDSRARIVSYSIMNRTADWYGERDADQTVRIYRAGDSVHTFRYSPPGRHNLCNLLAAVAMVESAGVSLEEAAFQLDPPQLKRRFERIEAGKFGQVIDDYAHHPTELRATFLAARERFPNSRIRCCFQPHQLSRTQHLREEFVEALALADIVFLLPVFGAREAQSSEFVTESQRLVDRLHFRGVAAMLIPSLDQVWRTLETDANPTDVLLTLGAGDLTRIHHERTRSIQRNHQV